MRFFGRLAITAVATAAAAWLVPGITVSADTPQERVLTYVGVALLFGLVNALVKPLVTGVSACVIVLTFGFFLLVINGLMLWLTSWFSGKLGLAFHVDGFGPAFWGALVIAIVGSLLSGMLENERDRR